MVDLFTYFFGVLIGGFLFIWLIFIWEDKRYQPIDRFELVLMMLIALSPSIIAAWVAFGSWSWRGADGVSSPSTPIPQAFARQVLTISNMWSLIAVFIFFRWKSKRLDPLAEKATQKAEAEEQKAKATPPPPDLSSIKNHAFRSAAMEVAQREPALAPQLLADGRAYVPPELPDFLTPADTSPIDLLIRKYGEPFQKLKEHAPQPITLPHEQRFEHTWILGVTGAGKTQLMQFLMSRDFETDASILVIDSQGDMIREIARLKHIQDRVILVEPGEVALNPFDLKGDQAIDLLTFVFSAMGGELTARQSTLYRYSIRLLQEVPDATLSTFMHMLRPDGLAKYRQYVSRLSEPARLFFQDEFESRDFKEVKEQVGWRLKLLLENQTFERMFNAPHTRLSLSDALNNGKIVLVDTNKNMLGSERSALFGRFFIALLLLASQGRREQARTERHPTFCYIDEAWEYLSDNKVAEILDQARKTNIGLILANQRTTQITNPNMLQAMTTTAIKFVSTDDDRDTHLLARPMKTEPEFLAKHGRLQFACFVRGVTPSATSIRVPAGVLEHMEHVPLGPLRQKMRELYGPSTSQSQPPDPDEDDTDPSDTTDKL